MAANLQWLIDQAAGAEAICGTPHCRGGGALDLDALAKRYGGGVTLDQLLPRLRCTVCGQPPARLECFATRHGPVG